MDVRALLITGTVGAGKTSVAQALGTLLAQAEIPHAVIDVDWLRRSWPTLPNDPFNHAVTLLNLRSVAANYARTGARRLVLAGVIETHPERADYQRALNTELTVCRLRVDLPVVHQRLTHRHQATDLPWYLHRAAELDTALNKAQVADFEVDTTDHSIEQAAAAVADAWK